MQKLGLGYLGNFKSPFNIRMQDKDYRKIDALYLQKK